MMENFSLSDIAAVTGNRNDDNGFGGNGAWWVIILLLALGRGFGWGNGYGDNGGGGGTTASLLGTYATQADLAAGFANNAVQAGLNDIQLGLASVQQTLCQGFSGVNTAILQGVNGIQSQLANCCCGIERGIDGVNYNIANTACGITNTINSGVRDVIENANNNSRAILDFLTNDKIATLTAENQALKFQASQSAQNSFITANQEAQTAELIRRLGRDCPVPAYVVPNPNCCYNYSVQPACNTCGGGF